MLEADVAVVEFGAPEVDQRAIEDGAREAAHFANELGAVEADDVSASEGRTLETDLSATEGRTLETDLSAIERGTSETDLSAAERGAVEITSVKYDACEIQIGFTPAHASVGAKVVPDRSDDGLANLLLSLGRIRSIVGHPEVSTQHVDAGLSLCFPVVG
jgi:hypothetical protein